MQTVLIASLGGSPQVVTETIWAILNGKDRGTAKGLLLEERLPTKIHLIGTSFLYGGPKVEDPLEAYEACREALRKRINQIYESFQRTPPRGDDIVLDIVQHGGRDLDDVRTAAENDSLARHIMSVVESYAGTPQWRIHFSIAGGRKTMGTNGQSAMMLLGSVADEISHVLVTPIDLENNPGFWWPGQNLEGQAGDFFEARSRRPLQLPLETGTAEIDLASTLFVPLRSFLNDEVLAEAVALAHDPERLEARVRSAFNADRDTLVVDGNDQTIALGEEAPIKLSSPQFALYATAALAKKYAPAWPKHSLAEGADPDEGWLSHDDLHDPTSKAFHVSWKIAQPLYKSSRWDDSPWKMIGNNTWGGQDPFQTPLSRIQIEIKKKTENPLVLRLLQPERMKGGARRKEPVGDNKFVIKSFEERGAFRGIRIVLPGNRIFVTGIGENALATAIGSSQSFPWLK